MSHTCRRRRDDHLLCSALQMRAGLQGKMLWLPGLVPSMSQTLCKNAMENGFRLDITQSHILHAMLAARSCALVCCQFRSCSKAGVTLSMVVKTPVDSTT